MVSESELIERVRRSFPGAGRGLTVGIGDDAAVLRASAGTELVITTDAFLENVHFLRNVHSPDATGYKALARATSDIAAMGARARCFFLTVGLPTATTGAWLSDFLGGMVRAARRFGLVLAGGDTTQYPSFVASLTVIGEVNRGNAVLRSGARAGDLLCVSGRLGEAELGWRMVQAKLHRQKRWASILRKHFYPEPRLSTGTWLASRDCASSMIDTSDGLSTDLRHICTASGVGAVVWAARIPAVRIPPELKRLGLEALDLAVNGGEDYELLFTVPKKMSSRLPRKIGRVPITVIGQITRSKQIVMVDPNGEAQDLQPGGWDPFRVRSVGASVSKRRK